MDKSFKNKFALHTACGIPGGQITRSADYNELVSVAQKSAEQPGYGGQVLILLAGTNDWANPAVTEELFQETYKRLVDQLLSIQHTAVILTGLVPRLSASCFPGKRYDMRIPTKIVRLLAKEYQDNGRPVRFVPLHNLVLEPGSADGPHDGARAVMDGQLKDGIHLAESAVEKVAAQLLFIISKMPHSWFPTDYEEY